ncbi:interleukin-31 receptor subunit alpha [Ambystoma mexicanum]|uniref:interleukin-31 receptor subunit alpha n=1 Tax=Ambystoma mexicanum TaxID=8296 RepID=UPI0037E888AF
MLKSALWVLAVLCRNCLAGQNSFRHTQIKPQSPVVVRGSTINISCILDEGQLSYTNSSSVFWKLNSDLVPHQYYSVVNERVSSVTVHNVTAASRYVSCFIHYPGNSQRLQQTDLRSGYLPEVPKNISCIYFHEKNFTCTWDPGRDTDLQTNYSLVRKGPTSVTTCQTTSNACSFLYPDLHFVYDYEVWVKAANALGEATSNVITMSTLYLVKTAPPEVISVNPIRGMKQMLKVDWKRPLLAPKDFPVKCIARCRKTNGNELVVSPDVSMSKDKLGTFTFSGLPHYTEYAIAVQCICTISQIWSDWSAEKTGRTEEIAPLKKVDLWRTIVSLQPNGDRSVHLKWKELQLAYAGEILGYRVKASRGNNASPSVMGIATEKEMTLNITGEAHWVSVIAYNAAGDSPEATLRIPAIGETPQKLIADVQTFSHNEQMVVRWKPSTMAVDGYVVEWFLDSDMLVGDVSWERISNSTGWTSRKGTFVPFKCYNISVFPLLDNMVGAPYYIQAYLTEGPPEYGPSVKTENLGKHEVSLKWESLPKDKRRGFITNYTILYTANGGSTMSKIVSCDIVEYTLRSLQSSTLYNVYIAASTKAGETNGTSIHFRTLEIDEGDIVLISLAVLAGVIFVISFGITCFQKKRKLKGLFWPDVPNPAGSTVAEWFEDIPKMTTLLQHARILPEENINVLDSLLPAENQTEVIGEQPKNYLDSAIQPQTCPYFKEVDFGKAPSPLSYVTTQKDYKSQVSLDPPREQLSESRRCLIQSSEDSESENAAGDEVFLDETDFNPYLKNSVMTREFIFPGNNPSLNQTGTSQQLIIINPGPRQGLQEQYVTVDMLSLSLSR